MNKDCVSLETARKLKEKGWDQFNAHRWFCDDGVLETSMTCGVDGTPHIAAPSIGELLDALPKGVSLTSFDDGYSVCALGITSPIHEIQNPTDALALLWIALKEKGILTE